MNITLWGVRGSVPTPGEATARYGGNTSCVAVASADGSVVILDAGTGIRPLGEHLPEDLDRVDILLSHLHMDHILGLGFFAGLYRPGLDVHIWGPGSTVGHLRERLSRYMSPPLFPVRLRELPCQLTLHDVPLGTFDLPGVSVTAGLVCHPGATVGFRLTDAEGTMAYVPDHEPALGCAVFPTEPRWTSGFDLVVGADLLIHDAQYADDEYAGHVGWGHSAIGHAVALADEAGVSRLVAFHHDPAYDDATLDRLYSALGQSTVTPAREGDRYAVMTAGRSVQLISPMPAPRS
jgi:phosphoribosyl 1,2-cyclic phosphodiesterase